MLIPLQLFIKLSRNSKPKKNPGGKNENVKRYPPGNVRRRELLDYIFYEPGSDNPGPGLDFNHNPAGLVRAAQPTKRSPAYFPFQTIVDLVDWPYGC